MPEPQARLQVRATRLPRTSSVIWLCVAATVACGAPRSAQQASDADAAPESGDSAVADVTTDDGNPAAFTWLGREVETCPFDSATCAAVWPPASAGTMYRHTSREIYGTETWTRTFHVYEPTRLTSPASMLIALHPGFSTGLELLAEEYDELADGRLAAGIPWQANTATCQYDSSSGAFLSVPGRTSCSPPFVSYDNSQPFVLVLPDSLLDVPETAMGGGHWEDGRVPSPGFGTTDQHRDDVGFMNHILDVLLGTEASLIDGERLYLIGGSNGGMMAERVACNVSTSAYPYLPRLAAFAFVIAALPQDIAEGLEGRERCPSSGPALPVAYFLGNDVDTPNCMPYGCTSPVTNGDGVMPYGASGGVYVVNSPDTGYVLAGADGREYWVDYNSVPDASSPTMTSGSLGYFTTTSQDTFPNSAARVAAYVTAGGKHGTLVGRDDYAFEARQWEFVSSFRRSAAGGITYTQPTSLTGTY
jgi:poly(3-hydroxybutyrate) depolymerase